ncbi:hypothetical protein O181_024822 [Austropuccinia psidii MF-1]|uniref:Uncharacterized protein n=1 Tax=Austropuccinia psidii MF-1 TaxID=1389203 RepID=A0A9Q3CK12_9BASI|nr:hypothetical protein [Austropuccinia psidii MF-1]
MSQRETIQRSYGNHQRIESQQEAKTPGGKGSQDKGESSHERTTEPDREYYDSLRLTRSKPRRLLSGFTQFGKQRLSDQDSQFFTIPGNFQEKKRIKGKKKTSFNQRQKESNPMIQKILDLVKEVHKSQK